MSWQKLGGWVLTGCLGDLLGLKYYPVMLGIIRIPIWWTYYFYTFFWLFTDCTMASHHLSPPFWENMFWNFSKHSVCSPKISGGPCFASWKFKDADRVLGGSQMLQTISFTFYYASCFPTGRIHVWSVYLATFGWFICVLLVNVGKCTLYPRDPWSPSEKGFMEPKFTFALWEVIIFPPNHDRTTRWARILSGR